MNSNPNRTPWDPRYYQIAVLTALLGYGMAQLDFYVPPSHVAAVLGTALLTQWACTRVFRLPRYDPRSALISALSLCLLLRTNLIAAAVAAAGITIASKFLLRWEDRHIFNPANFGLVVMLLVTDRVWISAGQWGSTAILGFFMACLGGLVVHRALRSDVTYAFLLFYAGYLTIRSLWLNEPMRIPFHRLQNGALLLFAFFMLSDPKTTPDSRAGRVLFAFLVAMGAAWVHYHLYRQNGFFLALALCSMATPLLNRLLPDRPYEWKPSVARAGPASAPKAGDRFGMDNRNPKRHTSTGLNAVGYSGG